jgi:hypothetical protein
MWRPSYSHTKFTCWTMGMTIFTHNHINHQAECWKLFLTWWVWEVLRCTSKSFRFLVCRRWFCFCGREGKMMQCRACESWGWLLWRVGFRLHIWKVKQHLHAIVAWQFLLSILGNVQYKKHYMRINSHAHL